MANYSAPISDAENPHLSSLSVQMDDFNTAVVRSCKFAVMWNPTSIKRNSFVQKRENVWLCKHSYRRCQTGDAKNHQLNSSLIQMDEGVHFVQRRTCWFCSSQALQLLMLFFSPCQYGWTKLLALSRDELAIRYEMEKYGYTDVAVAKHPQAIKLE